MPKLINDRDDLYQRENRRIKFELLVCRLIQFSETDLDENNATPENLQDIAEQWFFVSAEIEPNSSCLCGQGEVDGEEVKYVTYIRNRFTGAVARIGSSCIEKFGDGNPIKEEVALLLPLMKNHSIRINSDLAELMAKQKIITQLELALIKELGQKIKLEQNAIDTLSVLKAKIAIEKIPPSVTDVAEWIKDITEENPENPQFVSPYSSKKVTASQRLTDEYREIRKKLLVSDASEYEKQTSIGILSAFYCHRQNIHPEPKRERPNLDQCKVDKFQVDQCSADQIIEIAKQVIEKYIQSRSRKTVEERETYTALSVLLDAYQRFNHVTYDVDLLNGIQESIARLELEIEKLPFTMQSAISRAEEKLKIALHQNINTIETDVRQKHDALQQELQKMRSRLSVDVKNTVDDSRKLLSEIEAELRSLKEESNSLILGHRLSLKDLEEKLWDALDERNTRIDLLTEATEESESDIANLSSKIDRLALNLRVSSESLSSLSAHVQTLNSANDDTAIIIGNLRKELIQAREDNRAGLSLLTIVFLLLALIFFWTFGNRLTELEIKQQEQGDTILR